MSPASRELVGLMPVGCLARVLVTPPQLNKDHTSALHCAATHGAVGCVRKLLDVPAIDVNLSDKVGSWTAVDKPCQAGDIV